VRDENHVLEGRCLSAIRGAWMNGAFRAFRKRRRAAFAGAVHDGTGGLVVAVDDCRIGRYMAFHSKAAGDCRSPRPGGDL
jgi:hypothetical protein